ncbi:MAG: hypothetical protein WC599_09145, partial [Bacteroidales bacterium]
LYGNGQWGALPAAPQTYWQQNGNNIYANNTGNIGIGTSTPVAKLDVWGSQRITENLFVGGEVIVSDKFSARTVKSDTTVATKRLLVNHNLKLGSDSGSVESDIASKTELLKIQSDPASIYDVAISADNSSKVGIGTKFPTEKLTVVGNARIDGNATINGQLTTGNITSSTLTTNSIQTSQLAISDKLESDTIHAIKQLIVNNSLKIAREDINNFAEVSTKDTAVTLVLQKEEAAQVVIGPAPVPAPTPLPGQAKDKLTVIGNTLLQGDVNVSGNITTAGNITTNSINANNMNVSYTDFDSLQVLSKIRTNRITPLPGDSLIYFGDSSLIYNDAGNQIGNTTTSNIKGLRLGNFGGYAGGLNSIAIGYNVGTWMIAENAITIGSGGSTFLSNKIANSLMIGFNSNIPTFFVSGANGHNTTGNVGIGGTTSPSQKLQVDKGNILVRGINNFGSTGNEAVMYFGDNNHYIKSIFGGGLRIGTYGAADAISIQQGTGNVGIGTNNPGNYKLAVDGAVAARRFKVTLGSFYDNVFEKDYQLMTLEELEAYIDTAKHLPDIPSQNEVLANGLDIGEFNALLLKKIEELTLYIIEQNKRIETLESKLLK